MAASPQPTTYFWVPQDPARQLTIVARTLGDPVAMAAGLLYGVRSADPATLLAVALFLAAVAMLAT